MVFYAILFKAISSESIQSNFDQDCRRNLAIFLMLFGMVYIPCRKALGSSGLKGFSMDGEVWYIYQTSPSSPICSILKRMNTASLKLLRNHSDRIPPHIFWPSEISQFLSTYKNHWGMSNSSIEEVLKALLRQRLIIKAEFTSNRYDTIVRYIRGEHTPEEMALSLQRDSFLSHGTALSVHGMAVPGKIIYVNREQSPKDQSSEITQGGIKLAFRNVQRQSQYVVNYLTMKYMLLSGKHTARAGVTRVKTSSGKMLEVTGIERTLIDIVVRPAYAGGIEQVANAYVTAANKIDIAHMMDLLRRLSHAYPYHQAIGFLLERAGQSPADCNKLALLGLEFDFYLDYRMKHPAFNKKWRLYYPAALD
jgi:hypothetical protein